MASPLAWLTDAGSRLSTGAANAGGTVYFVSPSDVNTRVTVYQDQDASQAWSQPITLDGGGRIPGTVYVNAPCRALVYDSDGATVQDVTFPGNAHEGVVEIDNASFTGSIGTATTAGARTYLQTVLGRALTSFGGTDWKYKDSSGGTERAYSAVVTEMGLSVKSRGAAGNGTTVDTSAFTSAIAILKAAGGGILLLPAGTYLIDAAISIDFSGLHIKGVGGNAIIKQSAQNTNALTVAPSSAGTFVLENVGFALADSVAADSTGVAVSMTSVQAGMIAGVRVAANASSKRFGQALKFGAGCSYNTVLGGYGLGATNALLFSGATVTYNAVIGGYWDANGANASLYVDDATYLNVAGASIVNTVGKSIELANAAGAVTVSGIVRGSITLGASTSGFIDAGIYGLDSGGTYPIALTNSSTNVGNYFGPMVSSRPSGQNRGNSTGAVETIAGVGTFTPNLQKGNACVVTLNNAASNLTVAVPAATMPDGFEFTLSIVNTAAPAGAAFAAGYKNLAAVAISLVNGNISTYTIKRMNSQWYIIHGVVGTA